MNDLISRQEAIDALAEELYHNEDDYRTAVKAIGGLPSAKPEPIKLHVDHALTEEEIKNLKQKIADSPIVLMPSAQSRSGKWIKRRGGALGYNCSCCGKSDISNHFDYCPNCGADMRREDAKDAVGN